MPAPARPRAARVVPTASATRRVAAVVAVVATVAVGAVVTASRSDAVPGTPTTTLFEESFAGTTTSSPSWSRPSAASNTACLTGSQDGAQSPIPGCGGDAPGSGVLRLTSNETAQVGTVFYDASLPSARGIDVSFDSYQWAGGSSPADGMSFALAAADPAAPAAPAHAGPTGGALGYYGIPGVDGLPHGYLGVGLDVYGGFSNGDPAGNGQCFRNPPMSQAVSVRGPGDGASGYCVLGSEWSNGPLDDSFSWSRPAPVPVVVSINPAGAPVLNRSGDEVPARSWLVAWTAYGAARQVMTGDLPDQAALDAAQIPSSWVDPDTGVPYQLTFGWSGSTGSLAEIHALGNVRATTLTGKLPVFGLSVADDASGVLDPGTTVTATVTPTLAAEGDETQTPVVTTTVPDGVTVGTPTAPGYECAVASPVVTCTASGPGPWLAGSELPPISLPLIAAGTVTGPASITAKVSSTDGNPASARHDLTLRAAQEITVTPLTTPARVGTSQAVVATGGGATTPVELSTAGSGAGVCSLTGTTLSLTAAGTCVVTATQAGDAGHAPAAPVQQSVTVEKVATAVSVAATPAGSVVGQDVSVAVTVAGGVAGTVTATVDGAPVGSAAVSAAQHVASFPVASSSAPLSAGAHILSASFAPADATTYATSAATPLTVTVDRAATTTSVTVAPGALTARVAVAAPGHAVPSGTVRFSVDGVLVGSAAVVNGSATLAYRTPADASRAVSATFSGDAATLGSSGSTARHNPSVTARVTSTVPRSKAGWYRAPVVVTFTCTTAGAPLTAPCPAPVTLSRNGAGQAVTRTVSATDGGIATVNVKGIDIDRTAPAVAVRGIRPGGVYFLSSAAARCVGSDSLSGLASCTLSRSRRGTTEKVTARAVDRAGNVRTTTVSVTVTDVVLVGGTWKNGAYVVRRGHAYTLLAASRVRPRYVDAAYGARRPRGEDNWFRSSGRSRWSVGVTMDRTMRLGSWNLGVRRGSTLTVVKVVVTR